MLRVLKIQHIVLFVIVFVLGFGSVNKRGECYCEECGGPFDSEYHEAEVAMIEHCKNHDSICSVFRGESYAEKGDARCIPCDCIQDRIYPTMCVENRTVPTCPLSNLDRCINKSCSKNNCPLGQQCVYAKTDSSRKVCIYISPYCIENSPRGGSKFNDGSICNNKPCSGLNCGPNKRCAYDSGVPKRVCVPKECMNGNTYDPSICRNQFCSTNNCSSGQVCVYGEGDPPKEKCVGKDCMVRGYFVASDCNDPTDAIMNSPNVGINKSLCGAYNLMTGRVARAGVGVALVATGGMFFFGKIGLVALLSVGTGSGIIFGTPSIMKVVIGKKLEC